MTISASNLHKEQVLQDHLMDQLIQEEAYELRDPVSDYDRALAMDKALVLRFAQETQPNEWEKLSSHYTASAEETFFTQLSKALKDRGLLDVLRSGIKIVPGIKFSLCYFRPASSLEPKRVAEYEANILSVMKEVEYSAKHGNRLDVVLFLNGLPVVTIEAKNLLTGSTFRHAERQYRKDRSPAGESLLTFKRERIRADRPDAGQHSSFLGLSKAHPAARVSATTSGLRSIIESRTTAARSGERRSCSQSRTVPTGRQ